MEHLKKFDCVICRYGELGLKGHNRIFFEKQLLHNIRRELDKRKIEANVVRLRGRILIFTVHKVDFLKNIFGLVSFSYAFELKAEIDELKKAIDEFVMIRKNEKFRVTTKRVEKAISIDSMEVNRIIGAYIVESKKAKVDLSNYDVEVIIEFFNDKAYIFTEKIKCFGGLPSGIEGNVFIEIVNERDVVAALLMMKRGCRVFYKIKNNAFEKLLAEFENGRNLIKARSKKGITYIGLVSSKAVEGDDKNKVDKEFTLRPLALYDESDIKKQLSEFCG